MLQQNQIKVSPCRNNIVKLAKWAPKDFDDMQANWPKLRKVLVRFNAHHLPWYRCDGGETEGNVRHETQINIPMTRSSRMMLVADLEAAGYDVIDEKEKKLSYKSDFNHPYQESTKITVGALRRIIRETVASEMVQQPLDQLRKTISAMSPNDVATTEYVDTDSGEIYLSKGDLARDSVLHPQHAADREELARQRKKWAEEDSKPQEERLRRDVQKFASNWSKFTEESDDIPPEDAAHDAALIFFTYFPQWKDGSEDMTYDEILSWVIDEVYEAMIMAK